MCANNYYYLFLAYRKKKMEIYKEIALLLCQLDGQNNQTVNVLLAGAGVAKVGTTTVKLHHVLTNMHIYEERKILTAVQTARKVVS